MRDLKLIVPPDRGNSSWNLDIDIINGSPSFVDYIRNTQDQRAAIATYMVKGSVPGKPESGVDWARLYNQEATILDIDNEIKLNIQDKAAIPGTSAQTYMPIYTKDENGIHAAIYQTA